MFFAARGILYSHNTYPPGILYTKILVSSIVWKLSVKAVQDCINTEPVVQKIQTMG